MRATSHLFQYLYKYIHKGPDYAKAEVLAPGEPRPPVNEIDDYFNSRYLTALVATWRILGYHITHKEPAVTGLPVHLPSDTSRRAYATRRGVPARSSSTLDHYFVRPRGTFVYRGAVRNFADLTYAEYWSIFYTTKFKDDNVAKPRFFSEYGTIAGRPLMHVVQRKDEAVHVTRLHAARVSEGERFYLRRMLQLFPAFSFDELRIVNRVSCTTYQEAGRATGMFEDEHEAKYAMAEAVAALKTPAQLRFLFLDLLVNDCMPSPIAIWNRFSAQLSRDHVIWQQNDILGINAALQDLARDATRRYRTFNGEQRAIFDEVAAAFHNDTPLCIFIDGKAGRGKTFLLEAIIEYVRSHNQIAIATASTAHAALLYPGGQTMHSMFKIPVVQNNEFVESDITGADHPQGELIQASRVVVVDEVPTANRAPLSCTEAVRRIVIDRPNVPFGGKIVLWSGDFRQTCPVVPSGSRRDIVEASIRSSPLWNLFSFAAYVDALGDGAGPDVPILMLPIAHTEDDLINFTFPSDIIRDPVACHRRAILAPTNKQVSKYNAAVLRRVPGDARTYLSTDSIKEIEDVELLDIDPEDLLAANRERFIHGMAPHRLNVKPGCSCRLLRNMSISRALVRNVRVVIVDVGDRILTVRRIRELPDGRGIIDGEDVLLPRIPFLHVLPSGHTLIRKQFPIDLAYSTTFNSCQGLTLDRVAVDLTTPVFSHGQLYTALSRICRREHVYTLCKLTIDRRTSPRRSCDKPCMSDRKSLTKKGATDALNKVVHRSLLDYRKSQINVSSRLYLLRNMLAPQEDAPPGVVPMMLRNYLKVLNHKARKALAQLVASDYPLALERLRHGDASFRNDVKRHADTQNLRRCRFCEESVESPEHALLICARSDALLTARVAFLVLVTGI
ncbi:unnamed protein product [Peniophora sp. CBMAI 1063]|nr:unnamed protein product [Peniophora sp. CBMAI 1063]